MKELKFRFWNKEKNRYVATKTLGVALENGVFDLGKHIDIEQFTGLHDKNGNEIYEGDILYDGETRNGPSYLEVFFWEGAFLVRHIGSNGHLSGDDISIYADRKEIIGNIHENPELLEEK